MTQEEIDIINSMRPLIRKSVWLQTGVDYRDVMQDLFLKLLENYERFSVVPDAEKIHYVRFVCKNMLIDKWRRRKHQYSIAKITSIFVGYSDDYDDKCDISYALQTKANALDRIEVKEILSLLNSYHKSAELLLNCEGYKVREIAGFTEESINTVLGRIRYARQFLNKNHGTENQKNEKAYSNRESQSCERVNA